MPEPKKMVFEVTLTPFADKAATSPADMLEMLTSMFIREPRIEMWDIIEKKK